MSGEADEPQRAADHAVRLLSMRARTRVELERALSRRGYSEPAVGFALTRVRELGYLDDVSYANSRATALLKDAKLGPEGVVQRLTARGVTEATARGAVDAACAELGADSEDVARRLLSSKGMLSRTLPQKERARAERLLLSRGFDSELAVKLLGEPSLDPTGEHD